MTINGTKFSAGQRVVTNTIGMDWVQRWDQYGKIGRVTKVMGTLPTGYVPFRFDDGGSLLIHEDRIRCAS